MSRSMGRKGRMVRVAAAALAAALTLGAHAGETAGAQASAKQAAAAEQGTRRQAETKRIAARVKRLELKAEKAARAREAAKNPPKPEKVFISNEPSPSEKEKE